jgi:catechol 2,3-dioxygenase-like lactoylglutathione lyase family enzyme
MVKVQSLDHIVLNVADAERSVAWYRDRLGLEPMHVEEWRREEMPFPSVRVNAETIIDLVEAERSGTNMGHLCLAVDDLEPLIEDPELEILEGPVSRFGAQGTASSVYVFDPDENVVELRTY